MPKMPKTLTWTLPRPAALSGTGNGDMRRDATTALARSENAPATAARGHDGRYGTVDRTRPLLQPGAHSGAGVFVPRTWRPCWPRAGSPRCSPGAATHAGWPARELPGEHLHMLIRPAEVAAAITSLAAQARAGAASLRSLP